MRIFGISVSLLCALFFAVSLTFTFVADELIASQAKEFLVDRSQRFAEPLVEVAEVAVRMPGVVGFLGDEALQTTQQELAEYRRAPRLYIAQLVAEKALPRVVVDPGPSSAMKDRVLGWKRRIQDHFHRTWSRLLLDFRVFAGTNLVASLIAGWYAWRQKAPSRRFVPVPILLLASVCFETYCYVDGFTFFTLLFSSFAEWWYPAVLLMTFLRLFLEFGEKQEAR